MKWKIQWTVNETIPQRSLENYSPTFVKPMNVLLKLKSQLENNLMPPFWHLLSYHYYPWAFLRSPGPIFIPWLPGHKFWCMAFVLLLCCSKGIETMS